MRYEDFFKGNPAYLGALYDFLDIELTEAVRAEYAAISAMAPKIGRKPLRLTEEELEYVEKKKQSSLETWCVKRCEEYLAAAEADNSAC